METLVNYLLTAGGSLLAGAWVLAYKMPGALIPIAIGVRQIAFYLMTILATFAAGAQMARVKFIAPQIELLQQFRKEGSIKEVETGLRLVEAAFDGIEAGNSAFFVALFVLLGLIFISETSRLFAMHIHQHRMLLHAKGEKAKAADIEDLL